MYGLLGYPLSHSFSRGWFEARGYEFENFEFSDITEFTNNIPAKLEGFSVTIPHKQAIMPFLDAIDTTAQEIGAVNCVVVHSDGTLEGHNTDAEGFLKSLSPLLNRAIHKRAAVLGSGGASKAVQWVLRSEAIDFEVISRSNGGYDDFRAQNYDIIINTTPLGMHPKVHESPPLDYHNIRPHTICYDLVYNPAETEFLRQCRQQGAAVICGFAMLDAQAQAALRHYAKRK